MYVCTYVRTYICMQLDFQQDVDQGSKKDVDVGYG